MKSGYYENQADDRKYFYFHYRQNNNIEAHFHKNTEMLFIKSGRVRTVINGVERILTAGDIAVSGCFDIHYCESLGDTEMYILLTGGYFTDFFYGLYDAQFENFIPSSDKTLELLTFVATFFDNHTAMNEVLLLGNFYIVCGLLKDAYPLRASIDKRNDIVVNVLNYIHENLADKITLERAAAYFGYSKNHFARLFTRYTGVRFNDYLNNRRIDYIEKCQKTNAKTAVTRLALDYGFDSLNTYYRALKKFRK